jgi:hypothetical protein
VTAGSTYDSMTDVPTLTSATAANYCVINPLEKYSGLTIADGNLKVTASDNTSYGAAGTLAVSSGKWYYEAIFSVASVSNQAMGFVTTNNNVQTTQWAGSTGMFMCGNFVTGTAIHVGVNGSYTQVSTTLPAAGSYLVCAVDYDNGKAWFGTTTSSGGAVTWYPASTGGSVGDPAAGTNPTITFSTTYPVRPFIGSYGSGANWIANFGQRPFITTAPTGYNAWNTYNLPASTITNGAAYMAATLYTGTGATQTITTTAQLGSGAMVWTKTRSNVVNWDTRSTGLTNNYSFLQSNTTNAEETTATQYAMTFSNGSYTVGAGDNINQSTRTFVGYTWALGSAVSNTSGTITSSVQANTTAGVSVVTWSGNATSGATIGHGLGAVPQMIIAKIRNSGGTYDWYVYHVSLGNTSVIYLDLSVARDTGSTLWASTTPTSSVFSVGANTGINGSGFNFVAYCFAAVAGYSAFGSFTGNGSADGPFVYTGFRPAFVMAKLSSATGDWNMVDDMRQTYNDASGNPVLKANTSGAEEDVDTMQGQMDILSNGFKLRSNNSSLNASGGTIIYAAFAKSPFKYANAR